MNETGKEVDEILNGPGNMVLFKLSKLVDAKIGDAYEKQQPLELNQSERIVDHLIYYSTDVGPNGYEVYFSNASPDYVVGAIDALDTIGAVHAASMLKEAVSIFTEEQLQSDESYEEAIESIEDHSEFLSKLWDRWANESEDIDALVCKFVSDRRTDFA